MAIIRGRRVCAWFFFVSFFHLFVWFLVLVERKRTFVSIFGLSHRHRPRRSRDSSILFGCFVHTFARDE